MPGNDAREQALSAPTIERVAATASTNDDLLARVRAAAAAGATRFPPCLLVADRQSAGRGRHGRRWHAAPGQSLTCSLAWQPARADLAGLSLALGAVIADALDPPGKASPRIGLKWPNDVWLVDSPRAGAALSGRKLAGILVETAPLGDERVAVVGIGINIGAQPGADAASGVASLVELDAGATPASTLARVAPALWVALERFDVDGFAAFAERFAARDLLRGRAVEASFGDVAGIASGVGPDGALLVDTGNGVVGVTSGEWRLRIMAGVEPSC